MAEGRGSGRAKTVTEADWLACTDPSPMLESLRGRVSERKLRLFAVACCRRIWHLLTDERSRKAVEVAERFADGVASGALMRGTRAEAGRRAREAAAAALDAPVARCLDVPAAAAAWQTALLPWGKADERAAEQVALADAGKRAEPWAARSFGQHVDADAAFGVARQQERGHQVGLLRDIFGNPFRPITPVPAWLTWHDGLLASMARRMYDSRDFSDMPVLADALEEAGCQDQNILGHCRSGGQHVRGCWVVDLVLGKS
jgi:hypothetical protein